MKTVGVIWDEEVEDQMFTKEGLEETYREFGRLGRERGVEFVHGHFEDYSQGTLSRALKVTPGRTEKVEDVALDAVFDKFRYDRETEKLKKKMNEQLPVLNRFELERLCKDKLLSYQEFPKVIPETFKASENKASELLEKDGRVVLKPRFEFGGRGIKVIDSIEDFENGDQMLLQRFVDSTRGIEKLGIEGVHDLRVLIVSGEPMGAYVRQPQQGFLANVSLGASLEFVELKDVPEDAIDIVNDVAEGFEKFNPSFYSVDLIFDSDGSPWILEFNSKPGLGFYGDDEIKNRKMPVLEKVVKALSEL